MGLALLWAAIFIAREIRRPRGRGPALIEAQCDPLRVVDTAARRVVQMDEDGTVVDWNSKRGSCSAGRAER